MTCTIYVSTFGFKVFDEKYTIPIEVGAEGRSNFVYPLLDNTGENISKENPYYAELTGLYWIWKNTEVQDDHIIGFRHYNKRLWITNKKAEKKLQEGYDFIVCRKQAIPAYPFDRKDLSALLEILRNTYPDCYQTFYKIYAEDGSSVRCNAKNTFITTGKEFKEFCSFLFDVMEKVRKQVGDVPKRKSKRYCAILTERLFSAYLAAYHKKVYESDIKYDRLWMSYVKWVINRLPFDGNSKFLKYFRHKTYVGSYRTKS